MHFVSLHYGRKKLLPALRTIRRRLLAAQIMEFRCAGGRLVGASAQSCARSVTNFHAQKETRPVDHEFVHGWTMFSDGH